MAGTATAALLSVAEARTRLLGLVSARVTEEESVPLREAEGRVLAREVTAAWAIPGCDNSAMDGYAVRADDCAAASEAAPLRLPVSGEARTGAPLRSLRAGTAMAIATGGPIPAGADAVVPVEQTREDGPGRVLILASPRPGDHVRRAGGDAAAGASLVPRGRRLRPVDLAACAAAGAATVSVHRRPRVALLSGGDELVPLGATPAPHQVTDSNSVMLAASVRAAGGEVVELGIAGDSPDEVRRRLGGVAGCDLVLTSAGVSVGRHDHVREIVGELGRVEGWRIAMRPGRPLLIGTLGEIPMLGLPGNPASSAVTWELFGRTAVLALQGSSHPDRLRVAVRAGEAMETPAHLETYLRVRLADGEDGVPVATPSGEQTSSMLHSLAGADALLIVPAGMGRVEPGRLLPAMVLDGW
jgi:molybdopterin molybdotransferase